jgi:hypothetical protein
MHFLYVCSFTAFPLRVCVRYSTYYFHKHSYNFIRQKVVHKRVHYMPVIVAKLAGKPTNI